MWALSIVQRFYPVSNFHPPLETPFKPSYFLKRAVQTREPIPHRAHPQLFAFFVFRANREYRLTPVGPLLALVSLFLERFGTPRQPQVTASVAGGAAQEGQLVFFKGHGYGKFRAGEGRPRPLTAALTEG